MITNQAARFYLRNPEATTYANMRSIIGDFYAIFTGFAAASFNWIVGLFYLQVPVRFFNNPDSIDQVVTAFVVGVAGAAGGWMGRKLLSWAWTGIKKLTVRAFVKTKLK